MFGGGGAMLAGLDGTRMSILRACGCLVSSKLVQSNPRRQERFVRELIWGGTTRLGFLSGPCGILVKEVTEELGG